MNNFGRAVGMLALLAAGGCATVPGSLDRPLTEPQPQPAQVQSASDRYQGQTVRWGGTIARVENTSDGSLVEVVARPLQSNSRPNEKGMSPGRFLIVTSTFLDPEVFESGKSVTAVGSLDGLQRRTVGEYEYPYPVLQAESIHLWPPRPERQVAPYPDPWMYHPYWHHPYRYYHRYPYRYW